MTGLVLVQHPGTDTSSPSPYWGKNEHIASVHILLMTGNEVSQNSEISTSVGNPISCAQADGDGSMLSSPSG